MCRSGCIDGKTKHATGWRDLHGIQTTRPCERAGAAAGTERCFVRPLRVHKVNLVVRYAFFKLVFFGLKYFKL